MKLAVGTLAVDGMGGLLCLVQRVKDWVGSMYQMWQLSHQRSVYQSPYCCLLYNGPLLYGVKARMKWLKQLLLPTYVFKIHIKSG